MTKFMNKIILNLPLKLSSNVQLIVIYGSKEIWLGVLIL